MVEKDYAEIGRIVTQRKALNEEIDEIKRQLKTYSSALRELVRDLGSSPERVVFSGQPTTMRYQGSNSAIHNVPDDLIRTIRESVSALREKLDAKAEVDRKAQELGI